MIGGAGVQDAPPGGANGSPSQALGVLISGPILFNKLKLHGTFGQDGGVWRGTLANFEATGVLILPP